MSIEKNNRYSGTALQPLTPLKTGEEAKKLRAKSPDAIPEPSRETASKRGAEFAGDFAKLSASRIVGYDSKSLKAEWKAQNKNLEAEKGRISAEYKSDPKKLEAKLADHARKVALSNYHFAKEYRKVLSAEIQSARDEFYRGGVRSGGVQLVTTKGNPVKKEIKEALSGLVAESQRVDVYLKDAETKALPYLSQESKEGLAVRKHGISRENADMANVYLRVTKEIDELKAKDPTSPKLPALTSLANRTLKMLPEYEQVALKDLYKKQSQKGVPVDDAKTTAVAKTETKTPEKPKPSRVETYVSLYFRKVSLTTKLQKLEQQKKTDTPEYDKLSAQLSRVSDKEDRVYSKLSEQEHAEASRIIDAQLAREEKREKRIPNS